VRTFFTCSNKEEVWNIYWNKKQEYTNKQIDYINAYKERQLKTTFDELNLLCPYDRNGKFETKLFKNYSRIDKTLASMIMES